MTNERIQKISYIIAFLLFILGTFYLARSRGHAEEMTWHARYEIDCFVNCKRLTQVDRKFYEGKSKSHYDAGVRCYTNAYNVCWYLPRIPDRDKARACYVSIGSVIGCATLQSKLVASLTSLLVTYGLAAIDEWDYINHNLYESQYNFEMHEFYLQVLEKG